VRSWLEHYGLDALTAAVAVAGIWLGIAGQAWGLAFGVAAAISLFFLRRDRAARDEAREAAARADARMHLQVATSRLLTVATHLRSLVLPMGREGQPFTSIEMAVWLAAGRAGFFARQEVLGWQSMRDNLRDGLLDFGNTAALHGARLSESDRALVDRMRRGAQAARDNADRILRQYQALEKTRAEEHGRIGQRGSPLTKLAYESVIDNVAQPMLAVASGWREMVLAAADLLGAGLSDRDRTRVAELQRLHQSAVTRSDA
jgi:hypothetical protein